MGKAGPNFVKYTFRSGYGDYQFGVHPLWQFMRSIYQMSGRPVFISGALLLSGYVWALLTGAPWAVPEEVVEFRRKEQLTWLKEYVRKFLS